MSCYSLASFNRGNKMFTCNKIVAGFLAFLLLFLLRTNVAEIHGDEEVDSAVRKDMDVVQSWTNDKTDAQIHTMINLIVNKANLAKQKQDVGDEEGAHKILTKALPDIDKLMQKHNHSLDSSAEVQDVDAADSIEEAEEEKPWQKYFVEEVK